MKMLQNWDPGELKIKGYIMYYHVEGQGFTRVTPINTNVSCIPKSPRLAMSIRPRACCRWTTSAFAVLQHNSSACWEQVEWQTRSLNCFSSQI